MNKTLIIGFDEVGRGPIAGPVVVACVLENKKIIIPENIIIRDSKKMSKKQRELADRYIRKNFDFGLGKVEALEIDKIGINNCIRKAALLALKSLKNKKGVNWKKVEIWIDGRDEWIVGAKTLISGDDIVKEISMASIVAKVFRDELMIKIGKKYPDYKFENNVGYGTNEHFWAISKYGLINGVHRKSFCKRISKF